MSQNPKSDKPPNVLGLDLLAQESPQRHKEPKFAVFLLRDDGSTATIPSLSRWRVSHLAQAEDIDIIALDNVNELATDMDGIISFMHTLRPETKLVQVTGCPAYGMVKMRRLVTQHQLEIPEGKLSPISAAKACAQLAERGVGYELKIFEDETKVTISRARSKGPGGWSQKRYARRLDQNIAAIASQLETRLRSEGIDYDRHKGKGRAVFNIYATTSQINHLISSGKDADAQVKVISVEADQAQYIPLTGSTQPSTAPTRRLIIGLDPGLTVGLTLLSIEGKLIHTMSRRQMSRGQIVRNITKFGIPAIVCSDVYPIPAQVAKVAATFNVRSFAPRRQLSVVDKNEIARGFADKKVIQNNHQRDSLAAAYSAYIHFKPQIEKIIRNEHSEFAKHELEEIVALVLKGAQLHEAEHRIRVKAVAMIEEPTPEPEIHELTIDDLSRHLERKRTQNKALKELIELLERSLDQILTTRDESVDEIQRLTKRLRRERTRVDRELKRERALIQRDAVIRSLEEQLHEHTATAEENLRTIEDLRQIVWLRNRKGFLPIKVLHDFSMRQIETLDATHQLREGDTVLIVDGTGGGRKTALELIARGVKAVIVEHGEVSYPAKEAFVEHKVPVTYAEGLEIRRLDDIAVISEQHLRYAHKAGEDSVNAEVRERAAVTLSTLLAEYRHERMLAEQEAIRVADAKRKAQRESLLDNDDE